MTRWLNCDKAITTIDGIFLILWSHAARFMAYRIALPSALCCFNQMPLDGFIWLLFDGSASVARHNYQHRAVTGRCHGNFRALSGQFPQLFSTIISNRVLFPMVLHWFQAAFRAVFESFQSGSRPIPNISRNSSLGEWYWRTFFKIIFRAIFNWLEGIKFDQKQIQEQKKKFIHRWNQRILSLVSNWWTWVID